MKSRDKGRASERSSAFVMRSPTSIRVSSHPRIPKLPIVGSSGEKVTDFVYLLR